MSAEDPDQYANAVVNSRARMIRAGRAMLSAAAATEKARVERDQALSDRYAELLAEGLRRGEILARMEREFADVFSPEQIAQMGVSPGSIMLAVKRGPRR